MNSTVSPDTILETANSVPRPIVLPSVVIGYTSDLIIVLAKQKVKNHLRSHGLAIPY